MEIGNVKNTLEKDVDIKQTTADTEEVEAVIGSAAALEIIAGNAVDKTEDAETVMTKAGNIACEEWDEKFDHEKILKAHKERYHKVTNSPIPQVDGLTSWIFQMSLHQLIAQILKNAPTKWKPVRIIAPM